MTSVISRLVHAVRGAAVYNPAIQVAPACILWPDKDRQWESVIPRLRHELPELLILGDYNPEERTGPAIWLRCVLARSLQEVPLPEDRTPILYLPGVSRQDLRAVESCPDFLRPLVELQYRGTFWCQVNAKDWTILAFLKSSQGGLGLDVAQDHPTKRAMQIALFRLLDEDAELLAGKHLDSNYFNTLLTGGDPVRELLLWLDQGDAFCDTHGEPEWQAFVEVCKSQLAFDPINDGVLTGAANLALREGPWHAVWTRFCEAPERYLAIPQQIRKCAMPSPDLLSSTHTHGGWPQWNDAQEGDLRKALLALDKQSAPACRERIEELEAKHGGRRALVWAELGESPLAWALEHLVTLARTTANSLAVGKLEEIAAAYQDGGWHADDAVLRALACVGTGEDGDAVKAAIRAIYLPWIEESAHHFQAVVENSRYPGGTVNEADVSSILSGECILFVDGLRFDVGYRLAERLSQQGYDVEVAVRWAALPTVTATGKPAVTPVKHLIRGEEASTDFEPVVAETGQSLKGGYHLRRLLNEAGWDILQKSECGDGSGRAWCEFGNIDHEGHERGWRLARALDGILDEITDRVEQLLEAGWQTIRVVTDHGWLLLPGGLPKIDLPAALAETKSRRCALIKPGAITDERFYPWFWNPDQSVALADGVHCYRERVEYAHGGLSLQECLTPELIVSLTDAPVDLPTVEITDVVWRGLRCTVVVDGTSSGLSLDIRTQPGNPSSTVALSVKSLREDGTASVVIEDEELEGTAVSVVLIDPDGTLVAQVATVIGEEGG